MQQLRSPVTAPRYPHFGRRGADRTPSGITIAGGAAACVVVALVVSLIPLSHSGIRESIFAVALAGYAAYCLDVVAVAATVPLFWLVQDGFLIDRYGVLSWHGPADLLRVCLLVVAAAAGLAAGASYGREARRG